MNQAEREAWFLIWPDREEDRSDSPEETMAEIADGASEFGIMLSWTPQTRDTGFGLEKRAILTGSEQSLEDFLGEFL
jgi:hypothetical protein